MADAPPPLSCTVLGSAVLAVKLSSRVFPIAVLFVFVGVGPTEPDHLAPCLRALFFLFEQLTLSQVFQSPAEMAPGSV